MKTQVNGITIAYDDRGTGFPIVFLHAFPFNRTMWLQQETTLCQGYRTISIDLRGHGESDAPFWRYSLEQYAQDVKEVLTGLGIAGAVFVGLSMGGYLEFALYRLYPELIRGLVFADTKAEADKPEQIRWRFDLAQRTAAMGSAAVIADLLPKLLAPNTYEREIPSGCGAGAGNHWRSRRDGGKTRFDLSARCNRRSDAGDRRRRRCLDATC